MIDKILVDIVNNDIDSLEKSVSQRDLKILKSLALAVVSTSFITENQSRLLVKIINENIKHINIDPELLIDPIWSRPFRVLEQTKKLYLDSTHIVIEFSFSSSLRKTISEISKKVSGPIQQVHNSRMYLVDLTESNIVTLVDELSKLDFSIDDAIKSYYDLIVSWKKSNYIDQFRVNTIEHPNFQKQLTLDLGIDTPLSNNILADRSIRHQFYFDKKTSDFESLTSMIANRPKTRIWIDSNLYPIQEVFQSLIELKRLPILIVFNSTTPKQYISQIKLISTALDEIGITSGIGLYFRLPNNGDGKDFNEIIAERKYNCTLDNTTKIVCVESNKIPKFLLKLNWKPMSVISLNSSLKNSKTAVFANCCDLNITYSETQPLIESKPLWDKLSWEQN